MAEKKVQKALHALGKIVRRGECICSIGVDVYVVRDFIRIGS